jgi:hypothetical protein
VARDATARLYDVDRDSVLLVKLNQSKRYDTGEITFKAKRGKLIDLDELHESIWATRLSGGTHSGLVGLEVTTVGTVEDSGSAIMLKPVGSDEYFLLGPSPQGEHKAAFDRLRSAARTGDSVVRVTGRLDGWAGRWPDVLRQLPPSPRRILVIRFETQKDTKAP